jgi:hypothetical protein
MNSCNKNKKNKKRHIHYPRFLQKVSFSATSAANLNKTNPSWAGALQLVKLFTHFHLFLWLRTPSITFNGVREASGTMQS